MIRNIVFDVGYVLLDYTWKKTFTERYGEDVADLLGRSLFGGGIPVGERGMWDRYDNGRVTDEEIRSACFSRHPDHRDILEWFFGNPLSWCVVRHDLADLIVPLKVKGYRVYLLSNYPETLWKMHVRSRDFYPLIDGETVSWAEHFGKPDERFYQTLLTRYCLNAEECLFLDDRTENTQIAEALGFQTITLDSPESREDAVRYLTELPDIAI